MRNNFNDYNEFKVAFQEELYSIPIQIKTKSKWVNTKFHEQHQNLQTFYYAQLKAANYLRPEISNYEKNYTIIQLPQSVKRTLAAMNLNDVNAIILALANLDAMYVETTRFSESKQFYSRSESRNDIQVQQMNVNNGYGRNDRYGDRGASRGGHYRYNKPWK